MTSFFLLSLLKQWRTSGKFVVCQSSNSIFFNHSLKTEIASPRVLTTIHNTCSEPKYYLPQWLLTSQSACLLPTGV